MMVRAWWLAKTNNWDLGSGVICGVTGVFDDTIGDGYLSFLLYIIRKAMNPCNWSNNLLITPMSEIHYEWDVDNY